jgi:hypothetical protein
MAERDEHGRFIKGHSGNPNGRAPKEREQRYYEVLLETVPYDQWKRIIVKAAQQAEKGDHQARKWLSDYLIGAPVQRNELANADEQPFAVKVVVEYAGDPPDPAEIA